MISSQGAYAYGKKAFTALRSSRAYGKISALANQATSYTNNVSMTSARATSSRMANSAWTSAKSFADPPPGIGWKAGLGAAVGAAGGVGYDSYNNRNSDWRSKARSGIIGGAIGGLVGAGGSYYDPIKSRLPGMKAGIQSGIGSMSSRAKSIYNDIGPAMRRYDQRMAGKTAGGAWMMPSSSLASRVMLNA